MRSTQIRLAPIGPQIHPPNRNALRVNARLPSTPLRYSVAKFKALDTYCDQVSHCRVMFELIISPLPGLLAAVVPALFPLQDPQLGYNLAYFCHAGLIDFVCGVGIMVIWLSVANVPTTIYSRRQVIMVSAVNVALHLPLLYATARFWRYPIPFAWVLFACVFLLTMPVAHILVLRSAVWRQQELVNAFRTYAPTMLFQSSQIVFYPCFSLLFDHVGETWRVVLTIVFPLAKTLLKVTLQRLARHLDDHSAETAVCGIEISASLYQSMILQRALWLWPLSWESIFYRA